jgi:hypothetical protein
MARIVRVTQLAPRSDFPMPCSCIDKRSLHRMSSSWGYQRRVAFCRVSEPDYPFCAMVTAGGPTSRLADAISALGLLVNG